MPASIKTRLRVQTYCLERDRFECDRRCSPRCEWLVAFTIKKVAGLMITTDPTLIVEQRPACRPAVGRRAAAWAMLALWGLCLAVSIRLILVTPFPAPDELEHLSTAAYLRETGHLLPLYAAQTTLDRHDFRVWDTRPNYIGHPAPYYLLIGAVLDRSLPPERAVLGPRFVSLLLLLGGVALTLSAGLRWFGWDALSLVVFGAAVALCPELLTIARQVNNDALAVLGGGLAYWGVARAGVMRVGATREGVWRAAAAGLGLALALWAKPNAGLGVGLFLVALAMLQRAGRGPLLLAIGAGGLLGIVPYIPIVLAYGAIVPVTAEGIWPVHSMAGIVEYLPVFLANMGATWGFGTFGAWPLGAPALLTALMFWATLIAVAAGVRQAWVRSEPGADIAAAALLAFAAMLPIHLYFAAYRLGFSIPAASFRYYLPIWPGLAHAAAIAVRAAPRPRARMALAAAALTLGLGWVL